MASPSYRTRTPFAILAGITLLLVPPAFFAYQFFLYAATSGAAALQSGTDLLALLRQIGLAELLAFIVMPLVVAIGSFKRSRSFIAVSAGVYLLAWIFTAWMHYSNALPGNLQAGFLVQYLLWAVAWLLLLIVCLIGAKKATVGIRYVPWVLGLCALVAAAIQWLANLGGFSAFGNISFHESNIITVAAIIDLGINVLLSFAMLFLGLACGKASKKNAAEVGQLKAEKQAAKTGAASVPVTAPVAAPAAETPASYGFTPASDTIELHTDNDPFAGALSALDSAAEPIKLTLDGVSDAPAPAATPEAPAAATPAPAEPAGFTPSPAQTPISGITPGN